MEQIITGLLPHGITINGIASILQEQLIINHPDIVVYVVNDRFIYSAKNLESLKAIFAYENLEIAMEHHKFWVLTVKPRDNSYFNIYNDINKAVQPKAYTFFRLDAVNTLLSI